MGEAAPTRELDRATAPPAATLVDLLAYRAAVQPDDRAYTFLESGEDESAALTWGMLDRRSRAIAAVLQARLVPGDRAILLYPPGLDFVSGFFGCLAAGVIAVPVQPTHAGPAQGGEERFRAIVSDSGSRVALSSGALLHRHRRAFEHDWILTEDTPEALADRWHDPGVDQRTIAFLQYTSGSTARPRGVMVSHRSLLHNLAASFERGETGPNAVSVSWLPPTHDMGLIEGVLQAAFRGCPAYLMSPGAFLQRPMRWLQAIARYRAARSGGPNFAYELAVDRVAASDRARLDLTAWTAAYNGAEPVRQETLERFADAYAPAGFRRESFRPSYGLAEATLLVTTSRWTADAVSDGIVSCGVAIADTNVRIVDPVSDRPCEEGEIGEIRVAGPGVADGYWSQPDETARTFRSRVEGTPDCWLRTGDLGFSRSGSLYVTGRIKDLLIVRGVKYFPQDLERTAERVHPAVRPGAVAAVAVSTSARGDRVALIAEIDPRHVDVEASGRLIAAIRRAIADRHGLQLHGVALVPAGTVPKTPSGKLRRYLCREAWTDGTLTVIASWRDPAVPGTVAAVRPV